MPDRMDPLDRMLTEETPAVRAIHEEVKDVLRLVLDSNIKVETAMADGFRELADKLTQTHNSCEARRSIQNGQISKLVTKQEVNRTKLSYLVGGSAVGGGVFAKIVDWLMR